MTIKSRIARLEKERSAPDERFPWDSLILERQLNASEQAVLEKFLLESAKARAKALDLHPAGILLRQELSRLGLQQPLDLLAFDSEEGVVSAALRLVAMDSMPTQISP